MTSRKRTGEIITAAIFIILEVAALGMLRSTSTLQNIWISRFSHRVMAITWGAGESVRSYFSLKKQNDILARENFELSERLRALSYVLPDSIVSGTRKQFECIPASVVKMSSNSQHNYIILDKGSEDGVLPHSGIITTNGVAGIIDAVDKHYCYALSFMNDKVSVSARVGRTGVIVPMRWDGKTKNGAFLADVSLHSSIPPGDTIWTSGQSLLFPGDIPLGIAGETKIKDGAASTVKVTLFQDFSTLKYVTITRKSLSEEIVALENKEIKK